MKMNPGDVVVSGISDCVPVVDIGYNVPYKVAITIPGDRAYASKDLWKCIGQGRIFVHTMLPAKPEPVAAPEPVIEPVPEPIPEPVVTQESQIDLQAELARIQAESTKTRLEFEVKIGRLQAENARLRVEGSKDKGADKLDTIIGLIEKLPTQTVQVVSKVQPETQGETTDESVPVFIPSKVLGDNSNRGRLSMKESHSDGASVASASKALSKLRKKGG
jgi:hypothetical protein